jgi:N-acyl-D-amino-acid deacylase
MGSNAAPRHHQKIGGLQRLTDKSTYKDPHHYAQGVEHLFVNKVQAIENGKATGDHGSRALKRI